MKNQSTELQQSAKLLQSTDSHPLSELKEKALLKLTVMETGKVWTTAGGMCKPDSSRQTSRMLNLQKPSTRGLGGEKVQAADREKSLESDKTLVQTVVPLFLRAMGP